MAPLIVRFGALGDLILTTDLMQALSRGTGTPCDIVAHGTWVPSLLKGLPFVGRVVTVASRKMPYWFSREQRQAVAFMGSSPHHPVLVLEEDGKTLALMRRAGLGSATTVREVPPEAGEHVVDHYRRLAGLPRAGPGDGPCLAVSEEELADVDGLIARIGWAGRPLVLIQPGNRRTSRGRGGPDPKHWPEDRWRAVIRAIGADAPDAGVLVLGTAAEAPIAQAIADCGSGLRVKSLAGELPLRRLLALISRAQVMISVDTGPAHAAAALGCPLVVLFALADPSRIRPYAKGAPVAVLPGPDRDVHGAGRWSPGQGLERILPQHVVSALGTVWPVEARNPGPRAPLP